MASEVVGTDRRGDHLGRALVKTILQQWVEEHAVVDSRRHDVNRFISGEVADGQNGHCWNPDRAPGGHQTLDWYESIASGQFACVLDCSGVAL
ncbi:hypothetical protein CCM_05991 [Cordyceps militaris CM01]|uniref:Uncharacterized protein n=1 Tax=Cordyceps militaris (strain CM01) TaxID=983644 RepID=G3JI31_CORMM|nr:uncharacterized protein CCM_05991 [Cordyceps militaris CM01]EGX91834.1 hypothetical protein CCM_05991 [Cordyceps militaris CM01]